MQDKIYLDYNASAPLRPEAWEAMKPILLAGHGAYNASAVHHYGRAGRKLVEQARAHVARLVGAQTNQVIFNSGATEGNNTVLHHFAETYPEEAIFISSTEHPSIAQAIDNYKNIKTIPVDKNGIIQGDTLGELLKNTRASLISCMIVNNETGIIQNVSDILKIAKKYGVLLHCDATQAAGRMDIDMSHLGIDFLTLSAHKIGGPQGVGALALGLCGQTPTLLHGGGQEKSARAGTENVAGIAGFGAAAHAAQENITLYQDLATMRDKMESTLKTITPEVIIHAKEVARAPNTSFFSLPGADAQSLLMALDLEGIAVSNGSACSSGTVKPSTTLQAMGMDEKTAASALRISMGWATKESDITAFLHAWEKIMKRRKNKPAT